MLKKRGLSRRDFLKISGSAAGLAAIQLAGVPHIVSAQGATNLRFAWWEERFVETMNGFIDEFTADNADTQVELQIIPWEAYWDQLPIAIAGGEAPDAFFLVSGQVQNFAALGGLLNLTPYFSEEKIASFREAQRAFVTYNEELIALPFTATMLTTFTNMDAFRAADIELPASVEEAWTWDEFREVLRSLKQANPDLAYGYIDDGRDFWWLPWFYSNGASLINESLDGSAFNTAEAEETFTYLAELTAEGLIAPPGESPDLFAFGATALRGSGHWGVQNLLDDIGGGFELGTTYFPQRTHPGLALGGDYLAAYADGENAETSAQFLDFLTSEVVLNQYLSDNTYLSPRNDVEVDHGEFQPMMDMVNEQAEAMASELLTLHRGLPEFNQINQVFTAEYQLVLLGEKSPSDAVQTISDAVDAALNTD